MQEDLEFVNPKHEGRRTRKPKHKKVNGRSHNTRSFEDGQHGRPGRRHLDWHADTDWDDVEATE
jgi:hypothetical protein